MVRLVPDIVDADDGAAGLLIECRGWDESCLKASPFLILKSLMTRPASSLRCEGRLAEDSTGSYSEVCSRALNFGVLFCFFHYGAALLACHAAGINFALGCCDLAYKACNWGYNVSLLCFPGVHREFGMRDRMAEVQTAVCRAKASLWFAQGAHHEAGHKQVQHGQEGLQHAHETCDMQDRMAEVQTALNRAKLPFGARKAHPMRLDTYEFKMDKKDYNVYWDVRKGLIPIVGGARETGDTLRIHRSIKCKHWCCSDSWDCEQHQTAHARQPTLAVSLPMPADDVLSRAMCVLQCCGMRL